MNIHLPFSNFAIRKYSPGNPLWLRFLIIAGVFLVSIFLAWRATKLGQPMDILHDPVALLLPAALVILFLLRWPQLGLVGLILASVSLPFEIGTGTQTRLNSAVLLMFLLLGLWVFKMVVEDKRIVLLPSRTVIPLVMLILVATLAFAVGQLPWFTFAQKAPITSQLGGLSVFVLAAGAYLLVGNQLRKLRWLEWMTWLFLILGTVHILGEILPGLGGFSNLIVQRNAYTNSVFWIWLMAIAFSQAAFNTRLHLGWRVALVALLGGVAYVSMIRDASWTSGWLPALVAVVVILWVSRSSLAWLSMAVGAAMAAVKVNSIQRLLFAGDNEYSLTTRLEAWRIIAEIVKVSPILGLGPANYYWYTPLYSILGYNVQFNSHNNYVDLIAQTGVLGLAVFLWFAWEVGRLGWWLRERVPAGFARAYVYGALGGLAGMLVAGMLGDWILPFIYNIGLGGFRGSLIGWIFLGGLLALEQLFGRETQAETLGGKTA